MKRTISLLLLAFAFGAQAQNDSTTIDRVEIITIYKPDVAESVKVEEEPVLEEPTQPPLEYSYSFPDISFRPKAVYSPIDPIYLKKEKDPNLTDNYIELAGGNYGTSYLDANIFNTRDKYFTYGLQVKHHAASLSNNPKHGRFSENRVKAFGQRERGGTFRSMLDYQRNVIHYYGYDQLVDSFEASDINQIYNDLNAELGWNNNKSQVNSDVSLGFDLFDRLSGSEFSAYLDFNNRFAVGRNDIHLDLGGMYDRIQRSEDLERIFADLRAHYTFRYKRWDLDAGLQMNYVKDHNTNLPKFSPILDARTFLVPDLLRFFAGVKGGLDRNTMRSMTYVNPFLGTDADFKSPFEKFQLYMGMNGKFKRFVEYGIRFSHHVIEDQYLFVTDTNAFRNLTVVYDDISRSQFSAELKFFINSSLDIGLAGTAYAYQLTNQEVASHLKPYEAKFYATVRLADKISVSGTFYSVGPRQAQALDGQVYDIGGINDLNLKGEYRYRKNIAAFLSLQNILHQRYQLWNHLPAQGFNALAGIAISL